MKKILFFTSARSDYGLLKPLIRKSKEFFDVYLLVSGSHFLRSKGYTFDEIYEDGILEESKIFKISAFSEEHDVKNLGIGVGESIKLISEIFSENLFDAVIILGDRYELFSVTFPALMYKIPVFHISGGEITEGVIDDSVRHATTKLSHIHLVANETYAENVSLMGEEDWRINIVGENGLDNIYIKDISSKEYIFEKFGINLNKESILVTYHPSTLESISPENQIKPLINVLKKYTDKYQIIFTGSGNEEGSEIIENLISEFAGNSSNVFFVKHFGIKNYLRVMRESKCVLGNSSSGIVEAPSFKVPTVNIGSRQKNRMAAKSVFNCDYNEEEIYNILFKILNSKFDGDFFNNPYDPYRDGKGSERIVKVIKNSLSTDKEKLIIKKFVNAVNKEQWNSLLRGEL